MFSITLKDVMAKATQLHPSLFFPRIDFLASNTMSIYATQHIVDSTILPKLPSFNPDLIIMNWGAHYGRLYKAASVLEQYQKDVNALAPVFAKQVTKPLVFYRTTLPGHPGCGAYAQPFCSDEEHTRKQFENRSRNEDFVKVFKWDLFDEYNRIATDVWRKHVKGMVVLDAAALALARPDLHQLSPPDLKTEANKLNGGGSEKSTGMLKQDCLHFRTLCRGERILDHWMLTLLFNMLDARSAPQQSFSETNATLATPVESTSRSNDACQLSNHSAEIAWYKSPLDRKHSLLDELSGTDPVVDLWYKYSSASDPAPVSPQAHSFSELTSTSPEPPEVQVSAEGPSNVTFASCHDQLHRNILASSFILEGPKKARRPATQRNCSEAAGLLGNESSTEEARVAHCIVGSARTLWHPHAYKSIQDNFISALGGNYNTFMYIKLEDSKELFPALKVGHGHRPIYNAHLEQLDDAIAFLNPTKLIIAPEKPINVYSKREAGCSLVGYSDLAVAGLVGQIDTLRDCFRLVEEFESTEGMRFDWVTRIRPDTAIVRPVVPLCTLNSRYFYLSSQAFIDHVGIFGRDSATAFFTFIDGFYSQCPRGVLDWKTSGGITDIQAAMFERPPLLGNRMKTPIPVVIIRAETNAMADKCRIFTKQAPSVFGKEGPQAQARCMHETQIGPVAPAFPYVNLTFRSPLKNDSTSSSDFYQADCLSLFARRHGARNSAPSAASNVVPPAKLPVPKAKPKKEAKLAKNVHKKTQHIPKKPHGH
jgi:hypothetical protein